LLPVAREDELLVQEVGDETVVYDGKTKEAHCLSPLADVVFVNSDGRTTIKQLASLAAERLGEPVDEARVLDALAQLEERNLLERSAAQTGRSRREVLGQGAKLSAAAAAMPLITSIVVPTPASAQTALGCGGVPPAGIACCPCNPGGDIGQPCCQHDTRQHCNCAAAEAGVSCKQCKSQGAAETEETCCAEFPGVGYPPNADTVCPCSFEEAECPNNPIGCT
jgi:hypothetical protein